MRQKIEARNLIRGRALRILKRGGMSGGRSNVRVFRIPNIRDVVEEGHIVLDQEVARRLEAKIGISEREKRIVVAVTNGFRNTNGAQHFTTFTPYIRRCRKNRRAPPKVSHTDRGRHMCVVEKNMSWVINVARLLSEKPSKF